eukprot:m.68027 g.68027  ORF g.68027 m.68027 type:complete len:371 (+) comp12746_c0_seq5:80-1192(+)
MFPLDCLVEACLRSSRGARFLFDSTMFALVLLATTILSLGAYRSAIPVPLLSGEDSTVHLGPREALLFPVVGSAMLLCLYFFFRSIQTFYIMLSIIAAGISCFLCLHPLFTFHSRWRPLGQDMNSVLCALTSLAITLAWVVTNHWLFLNLLGGCMCIVMLSVVKVPTVRVALILYAGLLVYDVFWVFFSHHFFAHNVMTEVAQSEAVNPVQSAAHTLTGATPALPPLSLPAKLSIPALRSGAHSAMLGLGDVFVPGLLVAQCFRLDRLFTASPAAWSAHPAGAHSTGSPLVPGPPRLFAASLVGYVLGLSLAIAVSLHFEAAQPALLYILPCVVLAPLARACMLRRAAAWLSCPTDDTAHPLLPGAPFKA